MFPNPLTGQMYGWRRGDFDVVGNNNNRWGWNIPTPPDQPAYNTGAYPFSYNPPVPPFSYNPPVPPFSYNPPVPPIAAPTGSSYGTPVLNAQGFLGYRTGAPTQYAPNLTSIDNDALIDYNKFNPYYDQYAYTWNPDAPGTLLPGNDPRSAEGVPMHEALGIPWSSSYAPEYYQKLDRPTAESRNIQQQKNKRKGRPKDYIPQQVQYKVNGKTVVSRYGIDSSGNRNSEPLMDKRWYRMLSPEERAKVDQERSMRNLDNRGPAIGPDGQPLYNQDPQDVDWRTGEVPAWVGPLISWRT